MANRKRLACAAGVWVGAGAAFVGCDDVSSTCKDSTDCADGWTCSDGGTCEPGDGGLDGGTTGDGGVKCTATNEAWQCGGYACNIKEGDADGDCLVACETTEDCADGYGYECTVAAGTCDPVAAVPVTFVAIVSTTSDSSALGAPTPGPDIDAVELIRGSVSYWATNVAFSYQGTGTNGNDYDDVNQVLDDNNAIPDASGNATCELGDTSRWWWSMGDPSGFLVVEFEDTGTLMELETNDQLRVWEVGPALCDNVSTSYSDSYDVYVGTSDQTPSSALDVAGSWVLLGSSAVDGGMFTGAYFPPD